MPKNSKKNSKLDNLKGFKKDDSNQFKQNLNNKNTFEENKVTINNRFL